MDRGFRLHDAGEHRDIGPEELMAEADADGVVHLGRFLAVPPGRFVTVEAAADGYLASIPSEAFTAGAVLTVETSRLMVREGDTLCWNVKGVTDVHIGDAKVPDSVPENPPH